MLEGTGYETRLDLKRILRVRDHFAKIRPRYREFLSEFTGVDTEIFKSQIPGGMISNMESQLKGQGAGDRLQEVLEEVPAVRKDAGYPPLVTPSSQIVGTQAVFNVLMGHYKVLTGEFADLMLGYYGSTLGEKNPEVVKQAAEHAKKPVIDIRPADLLKPEWEQLRSAGAGDRRLQRQRRRRADLCHVSAGGAEVLQDAAGGAEESGQGPGCRRGQAAGCRPRPLTQRGPSLHARHSYVITLNGQEHRVTVAPASIKARPTARGDGMPASVEKPKPRAKDAD